MESICNEEELNWNPEEAKKIGSLKVVVEFKVDKNYKEMNAIEFSEPIKKKTKITRAKEKEINPKNKNKNQLF